MNAIATNSRAKVIACATVIEEMLPLLPAGVEHETLDFGLHSSPNALRRALQQAIDASPEASTILLGYGLCSMSVVGLRATHCRLVLPKVDDCIAIFLGSRAAYLAESRGEPGTYYLTKGWIEAGDSPFMEYDRVAARFGVERAERVIRLCLRNYTRLALINTGQYALDGYRAYARGLAERFGLRFEEIPGSDALVRRMVSGLWGNGFVVVPRGGTISLDMFLTPSP